MRLEEALAIEAILDTRIKASGQAYATVINLGSGDVRRLEQHKPWVMNHVFKPLEKSGAVIIHADAQSFDGACKVCDLRDNGALDFVRGTDKPRLFVLANVLEHVPRAARQVILDKIHQAMEAGDTLLITAPASYPYHPDPIDTLYRTSPEKLSQLLQLEWSDLHTVTAGSFKSEFANMKLAKKLRKIAKVFVPLQHPKKYFGNLHRLLFLFKDYRIAIALGVKQS